MLPIAAANQSACWDVPGTPSPFSGTWDSLIGNGKAVGVSGHECGKLLSKTAQKALNSASAHRFH